MSDTFEESNITTFMGGKFKMPRCQTVNELRDVLTQWQAELKGWGKKDQELGECVMTSEGLHVMLTDGVVQ